MKISKNLIGLILSIIFFYFFLTYTLDESAIFWYLYTFTLLIGSAIAILTSDKKDEVPIWKCLLFGIGYGVILYGIIRLLYIILNSISNEFSNSISKYFVTYGPNTIWHFVLLIFIIVIGEELFWRGYVQQALKSWTTPFTSIIISSLLFAGAFFVNGYYSYGLITFVTSLYLGAIYEWKKSMPLIIVAHETFIILLFLIMPFT